MMAFIRWTGEPVARLAPGEKILAPRIRLIADEKPAAGKPASRWSSGSSCG